MVKRIRRVVTGSSEIGRICGEQGDTHPDHSSHMTKAFWNEWSTSKKLRVIFEDYGSDPDMDVDTAVSRITDTKRITDAQSLENVNKCVTDIKRVNNFISHVKSMSNDGFDSNNSEHEEKLERLWTTLLPDRNRDGGRFSKDWGLIGFQQADPASDFRGGGILALDQLLYMALTRTPVARRMISEPAAEMSRYPWACVGINLTVQAIRIVESRALDVSLFGKKKSEAWNVFNELYADMFEILHARWINAKPENVLAFPTVLKETLVAIDEEVERNGSLVPPGTHA